MDENTIYLPVVNHEEQYSIWPVEKPLPPGWKAAGEPGKKQEVLDYIGRVWTDMRPLGVRRRMDAARKESSSGADTLEAS